MPKLPSLNKAGRLGNRHIEIIRRYADSKTPEEIAAMIGKNHNTIRAWISKNMGIAKKDHEYQYNANVDELRDKLKEMPEFLELRKQFTKDEIKYFEYRYIKIINQFKNDILPTEETQVFLLIKYEILMDRNLEDKKRTMSDISRWQKTIEEFRIKNPDISNMTPDDRHLFSLAEQNIAATLANEAAKTREYVSLQEKHDSLMKAMKTTRDQRISKIEGSKQTIIELLKHLQRQEIADEEGRQMELMKLAIDKEKQKLGEWHEYMDKTLDRPLLNSETVLMGG